MAARLDQNAFVFEKRIDMHRHFRDNHRSVRKILVARIERLHRYSEGTVFDITREVALNATLVEFDGGGLKRPPRHKHMQPTHEYPTKDKDMGVYSIQEHPTIVDRLIDFFTGRH